MNYQNKVKRFGILSVVLLVLLARANSNDGPVSASDQQVQAIDLAGKKSQQKVDLFTGSFGYSVPIACPPARNGSEPGLALAYSSSGELGWCGMGWDLNIGYIERNARDGFPIVYSTGTSPSPLNQYDDSKGFVLNLSGRESKLFAVATNSSIIEYRAEVDTDFLRCFCDTNNNNWTVYDKSGTAYYLGESTNTRVSNPKSGWGGYSGTFRWALDQIVTATGDLTTIGYTNYTSPNTGQPERVLYPTQITYNGHTSYNGYSANSTGSNTIIFQTEVRPNDWRFSYRYGFRTEQCRRLTNIVCSVGSQNVWSYSLKYGVSPATSRSLLTNVVIYGYDANNNANAFLTNSFAYQANPNGVSFGSAILWTNLNINTPGSSSGSYEPEVVQINLTGGLNYTVADLVDMDGDGLPDRVCWDSTTSPNQYQVQKNLGMQANGNGMFATSRYAFGPTSTGSAPASDSNLMPDGANYGALNTPYGRIRDLNGDGLPDRVMDYWKPYSISPQTPYYTNFAVMLNNGAGFSAATLWPMTSLIVTNDSAGAYVTYECVEGGGDVILGGATNTVGVGLFDINGDGLLDRVMTTYDPFEAMTNLYVQVNTSSNFTQMRRFPYKSQNWNGSGSSQPSYSVSQWAGIGTGYSQFIDLNGDGLPDHVMDPMNSSSLGNTLGHPFPYYAVEFNDGYSFDSTNTSTGVPGAFDQWPVIAPMTNSPIVYSGVTFYGDDMWVLPLCGMFDMNGDGLPDRVMVDPATWGTTNIGWLVYFNNGHGFNTTPIHVSGINNQGHTGQTTDSPWWGIQGIGNQSPESGNEITTLIDINGDGLLDRVMAVYYPSYLNPSANYFLVQLNQGPYPDLLTNINNGIGGTIAVTYNPSTTYDNRVDPSNANSVSHMPFPRYVTATVTASDGINSPQTTTYGYGGGYFDGPRREFHGFAVVTNIDPTLRYTVTYFHTGGGRNYAALGEYQDTNSTTGLGNFAKAGMAYRVETYGNDNNLYHVTVNQVDQTSVGNGRYFPFTRLSFDCDYPGPKVTAEQFAYDTNTLNLTNKIEFGQVTGFNPAGVGSFSFTDTNTDNRYFNTHYTPIGTYILDHPDSMTLTDVNNNTNKETDYSYNSGGTLATKLMRISAGYYATNSYANYTAYGMVGLITDPVGVQTSIAYDSTYNTYPAATTVGGTFTTTTTYDPRSGDIASSTDPAGLTVNNSFDSFCRPTETDKVPIGGGAAAWVKKYFYPPTLKPIVSGLATNYVDVVDNDGVGGYTNRTYIDGFGRTVQVRTQGENNNYRVVSTCYDGRGNAFLTTWPTFGTIGFTKPASGMATWTGYDAAGRVATNRAVNATFNSTTGAFSSKTDSGGDTGVSPLGPTTWSYVNGSDPWWIIVTDPDNQTRRYGLDAFGRTNQIQEVDGTSTYTNLLKYDLADNLTNIVNANGENIYWAYNDAGGLVAMADPYLGQWTYVRDYAGRVRVQTDARGDVISNSYVNVSGSQDPLGRLQVQTAFSPVYSNHTLVPAYTNTFVYDSSDDGNYVVYPSQLYKVVDKQGYEKTGYDSLARTIKTTRYLNINTNTYTTTNGYDTGDNVTTIGYPNGGPTINYSYFNGRAVKQVSLGGGSYNYYTASPTSFDEFGHTTNFVYGSGLTTTRTYYSTSKRLETISAGTSGSVFTRTYQYTAGNDVTSLNGTGVTNTITYFNLHRIKTYSGLSGSYGYDAAGNMTTNIEGGGSKYIYSTPRTEAVRTAFGFTNLYDLCGNMMVRHGGLTNAQALTYDPENRLSVIAQAGVFACEFGYAYDGTRLWKHINQNPTNIQVWIGNIYEEKGGKKLFHVFAGGEQVCTFETNSALFGNSGDTNRVAYYYHQDNLNSSSALSGSSGAQQEVNVYYPFGRTQTASPQASFQVSRRFTGQVFDAESGLYYYVGRYYDPELGRFIQADTIIPNIANPQSYNRYSYVLNDPLRYADPDGHDPWEVYSKDPQQMMEVSRTAIPVTAGITVAMATGGAAAPLLVEAGASTTFAAVGSGVIAGAAGDLASQGTQIGLGQRKSISGQEVAASGLTGAAIGGVAAGISKVLSSGAPEATPIVSQVPVKYNPDFATLQKNSQLVPSVTPEGRVVTDHAANRILNGGPGRQPISITDVDKVLNEGNVIKKVNVSNPKGATVTIQNTKMPGKPQVTVDAATGKRVVTVIQPKN